MKSRPVFCTAVLLLGAHCCAVFADANNKVPAPAPRSRSEYAEQYNSDPSVVDVDNGSGYILPVEPQVVSIMEIQGAGHFSPLMDSTVTTTGVVTAVDSSGGVGFYLQDLHGDGSDETSDAIFVLTGSSPGVSVGDELQLSATVDEYFPGGEGEQILSLTRLTDPVISVSNTMVDLPAPVLIGHGGRMVPAGIPGNDVFRAIDADEFAIDFFESLEAMRVQVLHPLAIAATSGFGEIFTVADPGISSQIDVPINQEDFSADIIQLDQDAGILPGFSFPELQAGTMLSDVVGVVSCDYRHFQVHPTEIFTVNAPDATANPPAGQEEHLVAQMIEHYSDLSSPATQSRASLALFDSDSASKAGDMQSDGVLDRSDYQSLRQIYGAKAYQEHYHPVADFNNDGTINKADLYAFLDHYWAELDSALPGDLNRDGVRDAQDRRLLIRSMLARPLSKRYYPEADLDRNYLINRFDLEAFNDL